MKLDYIRLDGTPDFFIVTTRHTKNGYKGVLRAPAGKSHTVTAEHRDPMDVIGIVMRLVSNHRENAILQ